MEHLDLAQQKLLEGAARLGPSELDAAVVGVLRGPDGPVAVYEEQRLVSLVSALVGDQNDVPERYIRRLVAYIAARSAAPIVVTRVAREDLDDLVADGHRVVRLGDATYCAA